MKKKSSRIIGLKDLSKSNRLMVNILMQEIVDVRRELKEDIHALDVKLSNKIDGVENRMGQVEKSLVQVEKNLSNLTLKVDKNQTAFIRNIEDVDRRVSVLEMAA